MHQIGKVKEGRSLFRVNNVGVFKRGVSPSFQNLPLPLIKGKGIQGIGLPRMGFQTISHQYGIDFNQSDRLEY